MSEAVEIVARALFAVEHERIGTSWEAECGQPGEIRKYWLDSARAAIQALRTPNPAILKILREGIVMDGYEPHPGQAEKIWDRCIDAALKESP